MSYSSEVLADSPLLYLRLDETSGTSCANTGSLGGNATTNGTVTRNAAAYHANLVVSVTMGGTTSDYISYPDTASLDITANMTYECWAKRRVYPPSPNTAQVVMTKGGDSGSVGGYEVKIGTTGDIIISRAGIATLVTATDAFPDDTSWHHLVVTRSTNLYTVYIDGASAGTGSASTAVQATAKPFMVGIGNTTVSGLFQPFDGSLDEVAVYNTALNSTRVAAHYTAATAASFTTWNGSATVSLIATVTTAGTATTPPTFHGAATVSETVTVTTAGIRTLPQMILVPRPPDSLTLVPVATPLTGLTLTPR